MNQSLEQGRSPLSTGYTQLSVSAVENNRHEYSPAHVGKLEIVRQGNSFMLESESDPVNDRSTFRPHYDILEYEDYSESETSPETKERQTLARMQGKVKSEGEISAVPHDPDVDDYDHVTRCQPVDVPTQIGELEGYDHFQSAHSEPLVSTSPKKPYVHVSAPSPHPSHRQRDTSPGEQTAAAFPNRFSFPGEARRSKLEHSNDESQLLLLHLSTTSVVSANSEAGERLANSSINQQSQRVHEISAQVTALQQVIAELQVENESLKQLSSSVQEGSKLQSIVWGLSGRTGFVARQCICLFEKRKCTAP